MRILLIAAANSITGGGERHVADLATGLTQRGLEVAIAAPAGGAMAVLAGELGAAYFDVDVYGGKARAEIRAALHVFKPDIVHAHGSRAALFARQADLRAAERCVVTLHGLQGAHGFGSFAKLALERRVKDKTAAFITVCKSDRDKAAQLGILDPNKTTVIYNGVPLPPLEQLTRWRDEQVLACEAGFDADAPMLLHVGRLDPEKNQRGLLHAFAWLLARERDARLALVCVGDTAKRAKLEQLAAKLNVTHAVAWLTPRANLTPLYASCDAFVLPSHWEGLPYTILEAMVAATPVVASNVDGIPEAVVPEVTGFLEKPNDSEALAETLEDALNLTGAQRREMGENARAGIEQRFSLERMIDNTVAIYEGVGILDESSTSC
ncbi:MAG: glycosyltransferase family 4 protein [Coriobacteriia bacterium]|nr:glycosyltransferase family 4 protein [Coriobacteriia bacterium]